MTEIICPMPIHTISSATTAHFHVGQEWRDGYAGSGIKTLCRARSAAALRAARALGLDHNDIGTADREVITAWLTRHPEALAEWHRPSARKDNLVRRRWFREETLRGHSPATSLQILKSL